MTVTKPTIGQSSWGTTLNSALDALDTADAANASGIATNTTAIAGKLTAASNLSDVANAATARTNLSLGNVTNTSDANKPVSTAQQTALDTKVDNGGVVVLASKYGALGNNSFDNYTAITAALTDIKASAAFAKAATLKLDAGTYRTSAPIALDAANLILKGDGSEATVLKLSSTVAGSHGVIELSSSASRVEGLTINANANVNWGIYGNAAHRARLTDVSITGTVDHGIYLSTCDDVSLTRVYAYSCGNSNNAAGFFTSLCENLALDHCRSDNNYQHGYYLLGVTATDLTMTACTAFGNGGLGISARYSRQTVTGCIAWSNGTGGFSSTYPVEPSTAGARQTVTGCIFGGSTGTVGNEVVYQGQHKAIFTGNYVETTSATSAAVLFSSCDDSTVTGNTIVTTSTSTVAGLRYTSCTGYVASGNTILGGGAGGNGIYIATSSTGKITENRVTNWSTGITLSASVSNDVHVTLNHITTVTVRVSNSSTGTNCVNTGNSLSSGYFDPGAPVRLPIYTTALRPGASTAGGGGLVVDSDLNRPIWSNGSSWKVACERVLTTATLDFGSIAAGATAELTVTLSLANAGDAVALGPPAAIEAGLMWSGYVSAGGGSVKVRLLNTTASAIDPASATWTVNVVR